MVAVVKATAIVFLTLILAALLASGTSAQLKDGYAGAWGTDQGSSVDFYLSSTTEAPGTTLGVYDVWHNWGRRPVDELTVDLAPQQKTTAEPWKDGFGYELSASYNVPADLQSGIYYLDKKVPFIVRSQSKTSEIVIVHPTNTANAYNSAGGKAFYANRSTNWVPADVISFLRPQTVEAKTLEFDRWMTSQDYDYRYLADSDLEDYSQIEGSPLLIIAGHSEYWTREARENFDRFVAEGGSALVLSGNTMYRPVTYDNPAAPTQVRYLDRGDLERYAWPSPGQDYPTTESLGVDYWWGGVYVYDSALESFSGYKIVDDTAPYLAGTGLSVGDVLENPSSEWDGAPLRGFDPETGFPIIDEEALGFYDVNLIGFDYAVSPFGEYPNAGTWIEFQKTPESGRVINVGSPLWTKGFSGLKQQLTKNMIDYLLAPELLGDFNRDGVLDHQDIDLLSAAVRDPSDPGVFDLNGDDAADEEDRRLWVNELAGTFFGDADLSRRVDFADFILMAGAYSGPGAWADGDFDGNGVVQFWDFLLLSQNFGAVAAPLESLAVPEPCGAALSMLALAFASLLRHTRRRGHGLSMPDGPTP